MERRVEKLLRLPPCRPAARWRKALRFSALLLVLTTPAHAQRTYALSLLEEPKLPAGFTAFPYVNPDAPKGGEVSMGAIGTFDSFNPFVVRGTPAAGSSLLFDTLAKESADEANTEYAHLAQTIELAPDRMWVAFELRPEAHFNDGTPVTAQDVAWSFNTLREKGRPFYRTYYADVADVAVESERRVVFHFKSNANHELPTILGQIPVLPEHWWKGRDFSAPLSEPPLGSGPYVVDHFELGRTVAYRRAPDYWAVNLPTARGLDNFGILRYEYFRDPTVAREAFKAGQIDLRQENVAKEWATAYDFPAVQRGLVKKEQFAHRLPTGMQAFTLNTRRDRFKDPRVREALAQVFDFEWMNKNLFYEAYTRTGSYFSNSEFASSGVPTGDELALLEPFRATLPTALFTEPFKLPVTDASGNNREGLHRALDLFKQAGWEVRDRKLVNAAGEQMSLEILLDQPAFERVGLPYTQQLQRLGIDARIRTVDPSQSEKRMDEFDFDMAVALIPESESLGNEQTEFWTCSSASLPGSQNVAGICDPAIDALVAKLVNATDTAGLLTASHALDRVLLWRWYMVPMWHQQKVNVAYWNRFSRPSQPVRTGVDFSSWWVDPALAAAADAARRP
jgi:microcin C transport system substrate-binding protein